MEIYTYLKKDHKKVSILFKKILAAKTNSTRLRLQDKIIHELLLHASSEQETFYKKLKQYDKSKECAQHGVQEHKDILKCIRVLIKKEIGTAEWLRAVKKMKETVQHHVAEEEGPMFRKAKQVLTKAQATALTTQMKNMKTKLKPALEFKPSKAKKKTAAARRRTPMKARRPAAMAPRRKKATTASRMRRRA